MSENRKFEQKLTRYLSPLSPLSPFLPSPPLHRIPPPPDIPLQPPHIILPQPHQNLHPIPLPPPRQNNTQPIKPPLRHPHPPRCAQPGSEIRIIQRQIRPRRNGQIRSEEGVEARLEAPNVVDGVAVGDDAADVGVVDGGGGCADGAGEGGEGGGGGGGREEGERGGGAGVEVYVADVGGWEGGGEARAAVDGHAEHGVLGLGFGLG